jgi:hypothetical protein
MNKYVAILGTLDGVVVGLLNFLVTRSIKQREWRLSIARDQITQRQPWPGLRDAVHFLSPGQGVLPPRDA